VVALVEAAALAKPWHRKFALFKALLERQWVKYQRRQTLRPVVVLAVKAARAAPL